MTPRQRLAGNPFFVLGVAAGASRATIEEAAQKLLGMLELGLSGAAAYPTPVGPAVRGPDDVRAALAELRDPARRIGHELWAAAGPDEVTAPPLSVDEPGWLDAFHALGVG
jgi:hypothetical protein